MKLKITDIEPMGAVRTTQRAKYKDLAAKRYANYKTYIGLMVRKQYKDEPTEAACSVKITFLMPIPKSKREKGLEGKPHTYKPDIDNLIKGCFDAINKLVWRDDAQVIKVEAEKIYSTSPGIEMEVVELF